LENLRRVMLLSNGQYGDPKVEKTVIAERDMLTRLGAALS
jgi:hypothetical protein